MIHIDKEVLKKFLIEEEGYSEYEAEVDLEFLCNIDEKLEDALKAWMSNRKIVDFQVEGVTLQLIMEKERWSFMNALLMMSAFIRKPELAKEFLDTPVFFIGKLGKKTTDDEYPWT